MATSHPRIQVTEDPELARALRAAAPHLPAGLSSSRQVRELAIAGARHIADEPPTEEQRTMLLDFISEWTGIIHESAAATRLAEMKADISETWFAWSGPTTAAAGKNITAYYRIQGPHLVIEYAPQRLGGDPALHVHTMYRDPTNDYGRGIIAK